MAKISSCPESQRLHVNFLPEASEISPMSRSSESKTMYDSSCVEELGVLGVPAGSSADLDILRISCWK